MSSSGSTATSCGSAARRQEERRPSALDAFDQRPRSPSRPVPSATAGQPCLRVTRTCRRPAPAAPRRPPRRRLGRLRAARPETRTTAPSKLDIARKVSAGAAEASQRRPTRPAGGPFRSAHERRLAHQLTAPLAPHSRVTSCGAAAAAPRRRVSEALTLPETRARGGPAPAAGAAGEGGGHGAAGRR